MSSTMDASNPGFISGSQGITQLATASTNSSTGNTESPIKFNATQGWYIAVGIGVSVVLANTKAGPFLLGILGVALIYQINLLLQHK